MARIPILDTGDKLPKKFIEDSVTELIADPTSGPGAELITAIDAAISEARSAVEPVVRASIGSGTYTVDPATTGTLVLTLTGNATLAFGTGLVDGQSFTIRIVQDPTGGRVLTLPTATGSVTLTTTANTYETLVYQYLTGLGLIVHQAAGGPYVLPWTPSLMLNQIGMWLPESIAGDEASPIDAWANGWAERGLVPRLTNHRPTLQFVNGRPVVRFDGTDDRLYIGEVAGTPLGFASGPYSSPVTIAFNVKMSSVAAKIQSVVAANSAAPAPANVAGMTVYVDTSANGSHWKMSAGTNLDSAVVDDLAWKTVVARFNGASSKIRVNGTEVSGNSGTNTMPTLQLGTNLGSSAYAGMDLGAVVVVGHDVSGTELTNLESWLNARRNLLAGV